MYIKTIFILFLSFILFSCNKKKGKTNLKKGLKTGELILKNVDFSEGNYALYIRHKKLGKFMVLDKQALINNRKKLKVKKSWINYLPGEGDRNFGVMLFKNNHLITAKIAGAFKVFEIGDLKDYAIPVKRKSFQGVKESVQKKLDSIKENKNRFITYKSNFIKDEKEYSFRIYFPSIAVPVTREIDDNGVKKISNVNGIDNNLWTMKEEFIFKNKWAKKIEKRIRMKIDTIYNFDTDIYANSLSDARLFSTIEKGDIDIKSKEGRLMYINDYMFYNFIAFISADRNEAEKLFALDYSDCLSEEERNRLQVINRMKELIKQSNQPNLDVNKEEVGLYEYKDKISKYKEVYQQEYQVNWLEIENYE